MGALMDALIAAVRQTEGGEWARRLLVAAALLLYLAVFPLLYPAFDRVVASLSTIPILAAAWLLGWQAGLGVFTLVFVLNRLLFFLLGDPDPTGWLPVRVSVADFTMLAILFITARGRAMMLQANREVGERRRAEAALHQSEARYRALFEAPGAARAVLSPDGTLRMVNAELVRLAGLPRADLEERLSLIELVHPEDHPALLRRLAAARRGGDLPADQPSLPVEMRLLARNGKTYDVLGALSALPGEDGWIVVLFDESERRRQNRLQTALYRISEASHTAADLAQFFAAVHKILGEIMPAENCFIALSQAETGAIEFPYYVDQKDPTPPVGQPAGRGLTAFVLRCGEPLMADAGLIAALEASGEVEAVGPDCEDWLGAPLKAGGRTFGVLAVQSYLPGVGYGPEDLHALQFVADQAALAIERRAAEEKLRFLSLHDALTGLYNRAYFDEELRRLEPGREYPAGVVMADLDGLKLVNDRQGHAAGDELIRRAAAVLRSAFRAEDCLARLGGDEFAVLLPQTDEAAAQAALERVRVRLAGHNAAYPGPPLSISLGAASVEKGETLLAALRQADARMYAQKNALTSKVLNQS